MEKNDSNELIVYWAPSMFNLKDSSWHLLYRDPEPILKKIMQGPKSSLMRMCPAVKDMYKNTFSFNSAINDSFRFDLEFVKKNASNPVPGTIIPNTGSKIDLSLTRQSSFDGYFDASYDMSWIFFAEESVTARVTGPHFPPSSPAKGAIYASGMYDIGRWFRPLHANFHIPFTTDQFGYNKDDEIFYIELMTNKKVRMKRFNMDQTLYELREECGNSPTRINKSLPLETRYEMADDSGLRERVLRSIKKNLAT